MGNEASPGKREERVEERLELVDGEDREDEGHLTSTWVGRVSDLSNRRLRNLPLLHDECR